MITDKTLKKMAPNGLTSGEHSVNLVDSRNCLEILLLKIRDQIERMFKRNAG